MLDKDHYSFDKMKTDIPSAIPKFVVLFRIRTTQLMKYAIYYVPHIYHETSITIVLM